MPFLLPLPDAADTGGRGERLRAEYGLLERTLTELARLEDAPQARNPSCP